MHSKNILLATLLAAAMIVPAAPALAFDAVLPDGQVVFGEDFTLEEGERLDGDLVVFGGNVTLERDSEVNGDVVVWGGGVEVSGTVDGDLVVFGGNVGLLEDAVIEGDLAAIGGEVDQAEGAEVRGQKVVNPWEGAEWGWGTGPVIVPFPGGLRFAPHGVGGQVALRVLWRAVRVILTVVLMAGLAGLVAVLWPQPAARAGQAGLRNPLPSLGVGLLTFVVAALVAAGLVITLCLSPLGLAVAVVAGVAAVFGWVSLGIVMGEKVAAALTSGTVSPFWSAALGAGLLTLLSGLLNLLPCVGWLGGFLVMCVALGAVVLTRFGAQDYPLPLPALPAVEEEEAQ